MTQINTKLISSENENLASGVLYSVLRVVSSILIPMMLIPLYAKAFGVELLGVFNLSLNIANSALVLGSFGLTIHCLKSYATSSPIDGNIGKCSVDVIKIRLVFSIAFALILTVLGFLFGGFERLEVLSIFILTFTIIGEIISNDWLYIYYKSQRVLFFRGLFVKVVVFITMLFIVKDKDDYVLFISFYSLFNFLLCYYFYSRSIIRKSVDWFSFPDISMVKYAFPVFSLTLASSFYGKFDSVLYSYILNSYDYGMFSAAYRLIQVVLVIITSWAIVLIPHVRSSSLFFNKCLELTFITSTLACLFVFYNANSIVIVLYGDEFLEAATYLSTMSLLIPLISTYNFIIYQNNKNRKLTINVLIFVIVTVVNAIAIVAWSKTQLPIIYIFYFSVFSNLIIFITSILLSGTRIRGKLMTKMLLYSIVVTGGANLFNNFVLSLSLSLVGFLSFQVIAYFIVFSVSVFVFKVASINEK